MVGSVLHFILDLKHVNCSFALLSYTVSILSLIRNSLDPKKSICVFFIVMLDHF